MNIRGFWEENLQKDMQWYVHSVGFLLTKNFYRIILNRPVVWFFIQGPKRLAGFALVRALLRWLWSQQYALNLIAQVMFSLWQRYGHMEDFMLWLLQALTAETYTRYDVIDLFP